MHKFLMMCVLLFLIGCTHPSVKKISEDKIINLLEDNKEKHFILVGEKYSFVFHKENYKRMQSLIKILQESEGWNLDKKPTFIDTQYRGITSTYTRLRFQIKKIKNKSINTRLASKIKNNDMGRLKENIRLENDRDIVFERWKTKCIIITCLGHQDYVEVRFSGLTRIPTTQKLKVQKSKFNNVINIDIIDRKPYIKPSRSKTSKAIEATVGLSIVAAVLIPVALVAGTGVLIKSGIDKLGDKNKK
ncbi:MAG TPA: hypothetical protein ENK39_00840 [Epsilonproteobacteria bacterium]|nr:hypothetical protein [Campylobacterota bacterium]